MLQGDGVTLILDGQTQIKKGITYSRFETVPDAPFTTFETVLPAGPHSILGSYSPKKPYDLCGSHLAMPTEITGQDGAVIRQTTDILPTGCPKPLTTSRAQKLKKALKACHKDENTRKRHRCETTARKKYGARASSNPRARRRGLSGASG